MKHETKRGSVFLLTVWVLALLSMLAAGLGSQGVFALDVAERLEARLEASLIAQAGVQEAIRVVARDPLPAYDWPSEEWANAGAAFHDRSYAGGAFTIGYPADDGQTAYGLVDEERRLNLNTAPPEALERLLFLTPDMREFQAQQVAAAIADWRDEDKEARPYGAEDFDYLGLGLPYACKDGDFEQLDELLLVKGMTPQMLRTIRPYITVHGSGQVNINTASEPVLHALGLSKVGVGGLLVYRAGEDNAAQTSDDRVLPSISAASGELANYLPLEDLNLISRLGEDGVVGVRADAFEVSVTAWSEDRQADVMVRSVITRAGRILEWDEAS